MSVPEDRLAALAAVERKVLWLATWMIHTANTLRDKPDGLKVGGHQASSASLATIMTALYFHVLRPQDRVAVKPHASPIYHAIHYLFGNQTLDRLKAFRGFGGAQSYPSRTKDVDDVDFSTGSVGLGVAMTSFASLAQDYVQAKGWAPDRPEGRMIALVGDAELDEGNIFEALLEGCKHGLRNTWWIIDYNRQSLDAVIREGLYGRYEDVFRAMGWQVVVLKYGRRLQAAFAEPGGARLRRWIDDCPNPLYSALTFQGGAAWRKRLVQDCGDDAALMALIDRVDDDGLAALMTNLAGHDLGSLIEAFTAIDHDGPVCFLAYTVKGHGLPLAGHKDNHAGLMTPDQVDALRRDHGIAAGAEWDPWAGLAAMEQAARAVVADAPFNAAGRRRHTAPAVPLTTPLWLDGLAGRNMSTQDGFGRLLDQLARSGQALADHVVSTSPDVTVSTNLGPWVNRRGLFARSAHDDVFRTENVASMQKWGMAQTGQHIELGIAENNLFILLAALGLSHSLFGARVIPVGTLYDPFIQRGLDALNYACYQDARFILVATPSGVTLAPEGGAHQSIGTPLIGMAQDGLAAFEPAYVDELAVILSWAFDYVQRDGSGPAHSPWLRDEQGGAVYLRLTTRALEQPRRDLTDADRQAVLDGAYWMRPPGPNCEVVIAFTGAVAPEAIQAAGYLADTRRDVGVLAVTSADRLKAGWTAALKARDAGQDAGLCHAETLLAPLPRHAGVVTVLDGHPATLSWIGGVYGHRVRPLGVEHFGQTGTIGDLYAHHGIDTAGILRAADTVCGGPRLRRVAGTG